MLDNARTKRVKRNNIIAMYSYYLFAPSGWFGLMVVVVVFLCIRISNNNYEYGVESLSIQRRHLESWSSSSSSRQIVSQKLVPGQNQPFDIAPPQLLGRRRRLIDVLGATATGTTTAIAALTVIFTATVKAVTVTITKIMVLICNIMFGILTHV